MGNNNRRSLVGYLEQKASMEEVRENTVQKDESSIPQKLKALIVDDLPENRLITRILLKSSFECTEAENGEQAVEYFSISKPDLILMDISMPVMNGVEALKKIREMNEKAINVPIIAVTTGGPLGNRDELLDEGFDEFIQKPVARQELFEKIAYFLPKSIVA